MPSFARLVLCLFVYFPFLATSNHSWWLVIYASWCLWGCKFVIASCVFLIFLGLAGLGLLWITWLFSSSWLEILLTTGWVCGWLFGGCIEEGGWWVWFCLVVLLLQRLCSIIFLNINELYFTFCWLSSKKCLLHSVTLLRCRSAISVQMWNLNVKVTLWQ